MSIRPRIDEVDIAVLKVLLMDARTSFATIAKDLNMSTNTMRMRYERLRSIGVIKGAITQINPESLGYSCIAFLFIQTELTREEATCEALEKISNVLLVHRYIGIYNLLCVAALANFADLSNLVGHVSKMTDVKDVQTNTWHNIPWKEYPENLIVEPYDGSQPSESIYQIPVTTQLKPVSTKTTERSLEPQMQLSKIDLQLIRAVAQNARVSFRTIAKSLGTSTKTVIRRYDNLKKSVLPSSQITIDLSKIGYVGLATFLITVSKKHSAQEVFERIKCIPNVILALRLCGAFDAIISVPIRDLNQLFTLKETFSKIDGLSHFVLLLREAFTEWPANLFLKFIPPEP